MAEEDIVASLLAVRVARSKGAPLFLHLAWGATCIASNSIGPVPVPSHSSASYGVSSGRVITRKQVARGESDVIHY